MEMNPTSLPELSKPSRASENLRKTKILETNIFRETGYLLLRSPLKRPLKGLRGCSGVVPMEISTC